MSINCTIKCLDDIRGQRLCMFPLRVRIVNLHSPIQCPSELKFLQGNTVHDVQLCNFTRITLSIGGIHHWHHLPLDTLISHSAIFNCYLVTGLEELLTQFDLRKVEIVVKKPQEG